MSLRNWEMVLPFTVIEKVRGRGEYREKDNGFHFGHVEYKTSTRHLVPDV